MKAIGLYHYLPISDPESFVDVEIDKPKPTGRDLLVQIRAISVNPVDTKIRAPKDQVEDSPRILGWDAAGIVEQVGSECSLFKPGDAVYYAGSITRPGSDSEFQLVDERLVGHKPSTLDFAQAAALPLTALTAWEGLYDRLQIAHISELNREKSILIVGGAGGVGSVATQLAHQAELTVISTASRPETIQWTKEHGSQHTINHHQPWGDQLKELGFPLVDYIFCLNSTDKHWQNMVEAIAPQGKICSIVETNNPLDLSALQSKSATFVWEFMFTRSMYQTSDMIEQHNILDQIAKLVEECSIKTTLAQKLTPINAANVREAHAKVEQGNMIGKIVLEDFLK